MSSLGFVALCLGKGLGDKLSLKMLHCRMQGYGSCLRGSSAWRRSIWGRENLLWEMMYINGLLSAQDDSTFENIFQLTDVSGPRITLQTLQRSLCCREPTFAEFRPMLFEKMAGQHGKIFTVAGVAAWQR